MDCVDGETARLRGARGPPPWSGRAGLQRRQRVFRQPIHRLVVTIAMVALQYLFFECPLIGKKMQATSWP
jgi:hypothetical protein